MDVAHHLRGPYCARVPCGPALLHGPLGSHVGQRQPLAPRLVGISRVVVAQGLLNLHGECVLPLDAVGVVGVHGPQQVTQPVQRPGLVSAGKLVGATDQVVRLLQQITQAVLTRQEWLHLRGVVKQREFLRLAEHT